MNLLRILFSLSIVFFFQDANAETLSAEAFYYRCHAHFTGQQPARNDTRLATVLATPTITVAINQCMDLLASANLGGDGIVSTKDGSDVEANARLVLQTFNDFHHSWFPRWDFAADEQCSSHEIYDVGEMALHLSHTLFTSSNYSTVVTNSGSFESIRNTVTNPTMGYFVNCPTFLDRTAFSFLYGASQTTWTPETVNLGELVGITPLDTSSEPDLPQVTLDGGGSYVAYGRKIHEPFGGGIIGTVPYLLLNMGKGTEHQPFNGGMLLPRRWSMQVVKDMLCRDLPVLRSTDVSAVVQSSASTSIPFRTGTSCMQCHYTMDRMTGVVRNLNASTSIPGFISGATFHVYQHATTLSTSETHPVESDSSYHQRPTNGEFVFRTYEGTLINTSVSSLNSLGTTIAATKDLYVCAAKRYYRFLTGVDVPIYDFADPTGPNVSAEELSHRNNVITLGESLQTHGNLQTLVRDIISLPIYRDRGYGAQ